MGNKGVSEKGKEGMMMCREGVSKEGKEGRHETGEKGHVEGHSSDDDNIPLSSLKYA